MNLAFYLLRCRKACACSLGVLMLMAGASAANAQTPDAGGGLGGGMDGDSLAGVDRGFAFGEPSKPTPPYQVPTTAPTQPIVPLQLSNWYTDWQAWKADLKSKTGTSFDLYVNPMDQVILEHPDAGINRGDIWYNFHLEQALWQGARVVTNTRGGTGDGLGRYEESLFNLNKNAGEATGVYISHLYFEQKMFHDHLTVDVGKLDLLDTFDSNEVGSWNFIPYSLARNPSIAAPYHAIGATARWDVTDWLYSQAGIADDGGVVTQTGLNTAFKSGESYFDIYEIGIQPKLLGRPGTYRFILWDASTSTARFDGSGDKHGDVGAAFNCDQQITDHLGVFSRYGYSDPSIHKFNHYFSVGGTYTGLIQGRKDDVLGMGIAEAILSNDYREPAGLASTQTQVDLYYTAAIRPWLSVTPDIQMIVNPDRNPGTQTDLVAGVNVEMRF